MAQLLVAWLPLGLILLCYGAAQLINSGLGDQLWQGATNALGFSLHITEPITADTWMFGGHLPSRWLQQHLHFDSGAQWYDVVAALVYASHFVVVPVTTAVLWFRARTRFRPWVTAVLLLVVLGTLTYVAYPMAPPWLAARLGYLEGVSRISGIGWDAMGLPWLGGLLGGSQAVSNPVAAMPSLHAGAAALVVVFFWASADRWGRAALSIYALSMAVTLVYTGEHYVLDVLAGWLAAAAAGLLSRRVTHARAASIPDRELISR